jgi:ribosomal protein S18 acetylase RimI-like enzyme
MLYEIEVLPEFRRQGIGRALLDAFLDIARQEDGASMYLFTAQDNGAAQALYRAAGGVPADHPELGFSWALRNT